MQTDEVQRSGHVPAGPDVMVTDAVAARSYPEKEEAPVAATILVSTGRACLIRRRRLTARWLPGDRLAERLRGTWQPRINGPAQGHRAGIRAIEVAHVAVGVQT